MKIYRIKKCHRKIKTVNSYSMGSCMYGLNDPTGIIYIYIYLYIYIYNIYIYAYIYSLWIYIYLCARTSKLSLAEAMCRIGNIYFHNLSCFINL